MKQTSNPFVSEIQNDDLRKVRARASRSPLLPTNTIKIKPIQPPLSLSSSTNFHSLLPNIASEHKEKN